MGVGKELGITWGRIQNQEGESLLVKKEPSKYQMMLRVKIISSFIGANTVKEYYFI